MGRRKGTFQGYIDVFTYAFTNIKPFCTAYACRAVPMHAAAFRPLVSRALERGEIQKVYATLVSKQTEIPIS
ncbi:hypothetical protein GCM10009425_29300 [Pseudomonas asuensis]|uniref:Uncharacterized protein n=1 Tax=Pseudomonas asuensis TaxID=1825787 RepID=A0ABQ2GW21_9PSED|nr:hypothetical protein GCM10009425_29300 [Pseudomonas asuensis]